MFAGLSQTMSFCDAAETTFYGKPCQICLLVSHARNDDTPKTADVTDTAQKVVLFIESADPLPAIAVEEIRLRVAHARILRHDLAEPPTPPPRLAVV